MKIKPQNTKGTRDFLPQEVAKRNFIFSTIKEVFRKYGFQEIETPAFERLETLQGKYGDEGDKLLFRILNSGDYLKEVPEEILSLRNSQQATKHMADKGLRYDLTVPLARYVVQHQNDLVFPFKRFHIGPVWRADRPQKGRYQEFYQCDADVIGSGSLVNEVELTKIYLEVFQVLNIPVVVRLIHRRMIDEVLGRMEVHERKSEVVTVIDKLDKVKWVGDNGIAAQLAGLGLSQGQVDQLHSYLFKTTFENYKEHVSNIDTLYDAEFLMQHFKGNPRVHFDPTLMRGLDYYTGVVWEVTAKAGSISGSLGGGGRYDRLTEMFGGQNMSGVGISFGIERIYDVMEELGLFPAYLSASSKILFAHFSDANRDYAFGIAQQLREAGISTEVYPDVSKIQKQMTYANNKQIPFVAVVGDDEMNTQTVALKNMQTGEQQKVKVADLAGLLR